ncbi:hypothetical protein DFH08DRAFT_1012652 [Mycena albidolilacea]|uniref:Uncharacterized protein n=1 Tax=Mycena albidolilacea TaxID=1033008 RepID=A0AAD6ZUP3_9AGAR|nr:hypothetical protein DFH08DRAFT_1012652 [Mycena albidolilacea]
MTCISSGNGAEEGQAGRGRGAERVWGRCHVQCDVALATQVASWTAPALARAKSRRTRREGVNQDGDLVKEGRTNRRGLEREWERGEEEQEQMKNSEACRRTSLWHVRKTMSVGEKCEEREKQEHNTALHSPHHKLGSRRKKIWRHETANGSGGGQSTVGGAWAPQGPMRFRASQRRRYVILGPTVLHDDSQTGRIPTRYVKAGVDLRQEGNLDEILKPISRRTRKHCPNINRHWAVNRDISVDRELPIAYFVIFCQCQRVRGSGLQARRVQRFEISFVGSRPQVEAVFSPTVDSTQVNYCSGSANSSRRLSFYTGRKNGDTI